MENFSPEANAALEFTKTIASATCRLGRTPEATTSMMILAMLCLPPDEPSHARLLALGLTKDLVLAKKNPKDADAIRRALANHPYRGAMDCDGNVSKVLLETSELPEAGSLDLLNAIIQIQNSSGATLVREINACVSLRNGKRLNPVWMRWMTRTDLPEVLDIDSSNPPFPWSEEDFVRCLKQRNCIGVVAESDGHVAGFLVYELARARIRALNCAVAPDFRRKTAGTQMMAYLIGKLSSERRTRVTLEVRGNQLEYANIPALNRISRRSKSQQLLRRHHRRRIRNAIPIPSGIDRNHSGHSDAIVGPESCRETQKQWPRAKSTASTGQNFLIFRIRGFLLFQCS